MNFAHKYNHSIKSSSSYGGVSHSINITCGSCGTIIYTARSWIKAPNSSITVNKLDFEYNFITGQVNTTETQIENS